MSKLFFDQALMPEGWRRNVRVTIGSGAIASVEIASRNACESGTSGSSRRTCTSSTPATLPASGPSTRLQTPTPLAAIGTVNRIVTTGITAWSPRWRAKSIRRRNTHEGDWRVTANGRYAVASVSGSRSSSP